MALAITNKKTLAPLPTNTNIGPGQAPVIAQPNPNNVPPNRADLNNRSFGLSAIISPFIDLNPKRLMLRVMITPKKTADPITPYIWNDSNLNIS